MISQEKLAFMEKREKLQRKNPLYHEWQIQQIKNGNFIRKLKYGNVYGISEYKAIDQFYRNGGGVWMHERKDSIILYSRILSVGESLKITKNIRKFIFSFKKSKIRIFYWDNQAKNIKNAFGVKLKVLPRFFPGSWTEILKDLNQLIVDKAQENGIQIKAGTTLESTLFNYYYENLFDFESEFNAGFTNSNIIDLTGLQKALSFRRRIKSKKPFENLSGSKNKKAKKLFYEFISKRKVLEALQVIILVKFLEKTKLNVNYYNNLFNIKTNYNVWLLYAPIRQEALGKTNNDWGIWFQFYEKLIKEKKINYKDAINNPETHLLGCLNYLCDCNMTLKQIKDIEPNYKIPTGKDIVKVHDKMAADLRRLRVKKKSFDLHGQISQDQLGISESATFLYKIPQTSAELFDWGEDMKNCIGGYGDSIIRHRTNIIGVFEKNNPEKCAWGLELFLKDNGARTYFELHQFRGKCNEKPTKEIYEEVWAFLCQKTLFDIQKRKDDITHFVREYPVEDVAEIAPF